MSGYKPAEHEGSTSVAPLLQFFELVHIGDTIQSMVQVFFDKDIVRGRCRRITYTDLAHRRRRILTRPTF